MYPVSNAYRERVVDTSRVWDLRIQIVLAAGDTLSLTKENIKLGTFVFKGGSVCSEAVHTGATFSNSVEFTISNDSKQYSGYEFYGAKVYPTVGLDTTGKGTFEYIPLGEFNVVEPVKKMSGIPIVCFDNMVLLNKPFDFSTIVFPTSVKHIYDLALQQCGVLTVPELDAEVDSLEYSLNSFLTNNATCRDVLAGIGVMLLKNMRFNSQGLLESYWYEDVAAYTDKDTRVGNSSFGDAVHAVTGVFVEDAYGNVFSHGTSVYPVELPTSPVLQGSEMVFDILERTLEKLQEYNYRPATVTWIGDPAIQAGDVIEHRDTPVGNILLAVMKMSYKFAGTSTFESLGPDNSSMTQQTSADRKMRKAFEQNRYNYEELKSQIDQTADKIELSVTHTISKLKIGAHNLIRNSQDMIYQDYAFLNEPSTNSLESYEEFISGKTDRCAQFDIKDVTDPFVLSNINQIGETHNLSFWARAESSCSITVSGATFDLTTSWQFYQTTYDADSADLYISFNHIGVYYVYRPQLVVGSLATDWSPAPEDFEKAIYDMDDVLESVQDSVSKLSVSAGEIKASVGTINETIDAKTGELNSKIEQVASTTVTSEAFKVEIERVTNEGVSKVSNVSGTFDSTGLTIDNSETTTKTNINPDGMKVLRKAGAASEVVLSASSEGVHAKNLYASTYLSVGNRSRFENYGSNYTGCFWTGD